MKKRWFALLLAVLLLASLSLTACRPKQTPDASDESASGSQDWDAGQDGAGEDGAGEEDQPAGQDTPPQPEDGTPGDDPEPAPVTPAGEDPEPEADAPGDEPEPEGAQPEDEPEPEPVTPAGDEPEDEPSPAEGPSADEPPAVEEPPAGEPDPAADIDPEIAQEIDQSAQALFQLMVKNDPSAMAQLRGYSSEEELLADLGLEGDAFQMLAEGILSSYQTSDIPLSDEVKQQIIDTVLNMLQKTELTTQVKQLDQQAGTAVVTCTVSSFGPDFLETTVTRTMLVLMMRDPDFAQLLSSGDQAALFERLFPEVLQTIDGLSPTQTASFDAVFERVSILAGGQPKDIWRPADSDFTDKLLSAIIGTPA